MAITEKHDVVIIGGGQAGLAMSYHLRARNRPHVILERARVAERWRSERWNSLCFQFPNWSLQLPGFAYAGDDPDEFSPCAAVTTFIEDYARFIDAPVRCGVNVTTLERDPRSGRFLISTDDAVIEASSVVIATGPFQRPREPDRTFALPPGILSLHASRYDDPAQLPEGAVLIVGSGSSGCQIAQELNEQGRTVYLSVGRHRRAPRRYRGRDLLWWGRATGKFDVTVDSLSGRVPPTIILTGVNGGCDMNARTLAAEGVRLLGRLAGVSDGKFAFTNELEALLSAADEAAGEFTNSVDDYVRRSGLDVPLEDVPTRTTSAKPTVAIATLDPGAAGVTTIIWCTGYQFDFDWVRLPVFDARRAPMHQRGVTNCPGAYFLGLHWMHKYTSGTLFGVGEDAAYLAACIAGR